MVGEGKRGLFSVSPGKSGMKKGPEVRKTYVSHEYDPSGTHMRTVPKVAPG